MGENLFEAVAVVNVAEANALARAFTCLHYTGHDPHEIEAQLYAILRYAGGGLGSWLDGRLFRAYQPFGGEFQPSRSEWAELCQAAADYREAREGAAAQLKAEAG